MCVKVIASQRWDVFDTRCSLLHRMRSINLSGNAIIQMGLTNISLGLGPHYSCPRAVNTVFKITSVFTGRVGCEPVFTNHVGQHCTYYRCPRPVSTGVQNNAHVHGPWTRSMNMGVQNGARIHGSWTRSLNRGLKNDTPVHRPRWIHWRPTRPVNMGVIFDTRVHGSCPRPVYWARKHGPRTWVELNIRNSRSTKQGHSF